MEISIADQITLDAALVASADRLKIGKCNLRLSSDVSSKEATLQGMIKRRKSRIGNNADWDGVNTGTNPTRTTEELITMKMEILLEPTSNKLMGNGSTFDIEFLKMIKPLAGNPVKKILLNESSESQGSNPHGSAGYLKWWWRSLFPPCLTRSITNMLMTRADKHKVPHRKLKYLFQDLPLPDTTQHPRSVKVVKLKIFKKKATLKLFRMVSMSVQKNLKSTRWQSYKIA
ncbi:hypothetical protein Tco_0155961 [Tanacetum coccineum]